MRFSDLVGHHRIVHLLARATARGTLPPTLLFAGPSGVGKWRTAVTLAAVVNCLNPQRPGEDGSDPRPSDSSEKPDASLLPVDACGVCRACDRIARDVHVDVLRLEPDDRASIKIDAVRSVLERTSFRPFEGRRRMVLIREAETLEPAAQNALLKSLEEPLPATAFILTTAVAGALLPTVRSRCMRMAFGRLTAAEVAAVLVRHHEYDEADARSAAALADGSAGQALALGSTDLAVLSETAMLLLRQAASDASVPARLQAAQVLAGDTAKKERSREDIGLILRALASMLRDIEVLNAGADSGVLANPALASDLSRMQRAFAGDRARDAFAAVDRALVALERNAGVKVVAEWLSVQL